MASSRDHDKRIASLTFASIYPHYLKKIESKGRSEKELLTVIKWLTGFSKQKINELIKKEVTLKRFSNQHPSILTPYTLLA